MLCFIAFLMKIQVLLQHVRQFFRVLYYYEFLNRLYS